MTPRDTLAEWRTLVANRLLARTAIQRWLSAAKWAIYPALVRWMPRVAIAIHEPESTRAFWNAIKPGMTVVDAGANMGGFSILAANRVGNAGRVFAFEPEPHNCRTLARRMRRFPMVTVVGKAVSDRVGEASLHLDSFHAGHSLVGVQEGSAVGEITVPMTSLDAFVREHDLPGLDFVKLDVEGVELQVIAGMIEQMRSSRPPAILCEVHAPNRPEDVIAALVPHGYRCEVLDASLTGEVHRVPVHILASPRRE